MEATETMEFTVMVEEREKYFIRLYEDSFPGVARFVAARGGSFEDAKDIFHDALVIFYEKMINEKFSPNVSREGYVMGIAKHLWLRKFNEDHKKTNVDEMDETITIPEEYFDVAENRLTSLLELTGRKCLELLRAFYYDNLPMQHIRETFGFSSGHSASVQKYKCIEKVRNIVQQKSMDYEDFT